MADHYTAERAVRSFRARGFLPIFDCVRMVYDIPMCEECRELKATRERALTLDDQPMGTHVLRSRRSVALPPQCTLGHSGQGDLNFVSY
jgi:hypothetical protein